MSKNPEKGKNSFVRLSFSEEMINGNTFPLLFLLFLYYLFDELDAPYSFHSEKYFFKSSVTETASRDETGVLIWIGKFKSDFLTTSHSFCVSF